MYAERNSLTIHPGKCKVLILSKKRFIGPFPKLDLCGKSLDIVSSTKCLGVDIDDELKWDVHTTKIAKRFSTKVKKMYQMREMPKSTLCSIYFQGILPSILYGILIWGNCSPSSMANIERIHIRAARFIHRMKKSIPDSAVLDLVKWKSIMFYYKRVLHAKFIRSTMSFHLHYYQT